MKSLIAALFFLFLCLSGCKENPVQPSGPTVEIVSPKGNISNYDSVYVVIRAEDNKKVVRVELFIDHQMVMVFTKGPYEFTWYTEYYLDASQHVLEARAYDEDGNDAVTKPVIIYLYRFRPSNLTASFQSDTTVHLSWMDNSKVETGFEIEKRVNQGEFAFVQKVDSNVTSTFVQCSNAFTDTIYFRVRALKGEEKSEYSTAMAYRILTAPSNIQFTFASDTTLHVTWKDNTAFETGYRIQVNPSQATVDVPANSTEASVPLHLVNGTSYTVFVTAIRGNISSIGTWNVFKQFTVPAPFDLAVSSPQANQLTLSWKDTCAYEKGFVIERALESGAFQVIGRTAPNILQFTDTGVDSSKQYSYRVTTETKYSASAYSATLVVGYLPGLALIKSVSVPFSPHTLLLSKDEKKAVTTDFNARSITIWNTESMAQETQIVYSDSTAQGPQCAALHPDGKTVAVGYYYKYAMIFDIASGEKIATIDQAARAGVKDIRYNSDGTKLVTCGWGINVWQDKTYASLGTLLNVHSLYWMDRSPAEDVIIANPADGGGVRLYDVNSFASVRQLDNSNDALACSFSTDGALIAGKTSTGIRVWDTKTGSVLNQLTNVWDIGNVAMNAKRDLVFTTSSYKGGISIWSLKTTKQLANVKDNLSDNENIQLSSDGRYLYSAGWKAVQKWEIRNEWKPVM